MIINGSVALVTGGASGIGKAICDLLLQNGALVNFVDVNKQKGEELELLFCDKHGSGKAKFYHCDVTSQGQLEECFEKIIKDHGGLDILCNNAGILDERDWAKTINVNLTAVMQGTHLGVKHLNRNGIIINMSSTGGLHPISFSPAYCAAKYGVVGFTRSVAPAAFREKGIRINCVCPGATDTNIFKAMLTNEMTKEQEQLAANTPKQTPEVVAQATVDLIKDNRDNGQVVKVTYEEGVEYIDFSDIVL